LKWDQYTENWKEIKVPWLYMHLYASILNWYDVWWLSYMFIRNHFGLNETRVLEIERKSRYHGYIVSIYFSMVELIWYVIWLNDECICNSYDWNEIRILGIEKKSRYRDCIWICVHSIWLKWSQYEWNEVCMIEMN